MYEDEVRRRCKMPTYDGRCMMMYYGVVHVDAFGARWSMVICGNGNFVRW